MAEEGGQLGLGHDMVRHGGLELEDGRAWRESERRVKRVELEHVVVRRPAGRRTRGLITHHATTILALQRAVRQRTRRRRSSLELRHA